MMMFPKPEKLAKKAKSTSAERAYLAAVAQLPCVCCGRIPVEVHHTICGRYSQRRTPHWHAIPLCDQHHQGKWNTEGPAIHKSRKSWEEKYGLDVNYIAETQRRVSEKFGLDVPEKYRR